MNAQNTNTTAKAPKGWGLEAPEGARFHWSARAIYRDATIDLLWDRAGFEGDADADSKRALADWIDAKAIPYLRGYVAHDVAAPLPSERGECIVVRGDGYVLRCDPKASYGYLYLSAAPDPTATDATPPAPKPPARPKRAAPRRKPDLAKTYGYLYLKGK